MMLGYRFINSYVDGVIMYASEFKDIPAAIKVNDDVRLYMINLIQGAPLLGKIVEGGNRLDVFRQILVDFANGRLDFAAAYRETENQLPRHVSIYAHDNRVFAHGWAERLVRTQVSRFYNQAVMELALGRGESQCFVPPSTAEQSSSPCSVSLAGRVHDISHLHSLLVTAYEQGHWGNKTPKIPDHPHCTHVVKPVNV